MEVQVIGCPGGTGCRVSWRYSSPSLAGNGTKRDVSLVLNSQHRLINWPCCICYYEYNVSSLYLCRGVKELGFHLESVSYNRIIYQIRAYHVQVPPMIRPHHVCRVRGSRVITSREARPPSRAAHTASPMPPTKVDPGEEKNLIIL